jgi:hypothetical protein
MRSALFLLSTLGMLLADTAAHGHPPSLPGISPELVRQAISAYCSEHIDLPHDGSGPWIELIGKAGGPEELRKVFSQVATERFNPDCKTLQRLLFAPDPGVQGMRNAECGKKESLKAGIRS